MKLKINGEDRSLPQLGRLSEVLDALEIEQDGIAVALNGTVVSRDRFAGTSVAAGDSLEIIRAVAGG